MGTCCVPTKVPDQISKRQLKALKVTYKRRGHGFEGVSPVEACCTGADPGGRSVAGSVPESVGRNAINKTTLNTYCVFQLNCIYA